MDNANEQPEAANNNNVYIYFYYFNIKNIFMYFNISIWEFINYIYLIYFE